MGAEQAAGTARLAARVEIRPCTRLEEFERCVELQRLIWGFTDIDLVPSALFVVAAHSGGQVFGAYDGAEMIGFVMALAGVRAGQPFLHSHMAAVLPAYQNAGVGRRLKRQQREDALARGIRLVEWTFDPLELRNAHFNLERLGAIARRYLPNLYGRTTSPLHATLPTDRLLAEWWLDTPRVEARLAGHAEARPRAAERIQVSGKIAEWRRTDPLAAERVQRDVREQFEHWFGKGYAALGFEVEPGSGDGTYLLARYES